MKLEAFSNNVRSSLLNTIKMRSQSDLPELQSRFIIDTDFSEKMIVYTLERVHELLLEVIIYIEKLITQFKERINHKKHGTEYLEIHKSDLRSILDSIMTQKFIASIPDSENIQLDIDSTWKKYMKLLDESTAD